MSGHGVKVYRPMDMVDVENLERVAESLKSKLDKLKEDEWMYVSADTLFKRDQGTS
jgi:hypothetical protein